jgi:hypothetical protein
VAEVDLPGVTLVVGEGKRRDAPLVRVTRIGRATVEFVARTALPMPHSDLKLIVDFGGGGRTDGSYIPSPLASPGIVPDCPAR